MSANESLICSCSIHTNSETFLVVCCCNMPKFCKFIHKGLCLVPPESSLPKVPQSSFFVCKFNISIFVKEQSPTTTHIQCMFVINMKRVIIILKLLLLVLTAAAPCTVVSIPNCTLIDINNTHGSTNSCFCLTCDVGLVRSLNQLSCCQSGTNYCLQCENFTCVKCYQGYGYVGNTTLCQLCYSIIPKCSICNYTDNCSMCTTGYGFNDSTTECSLCSAQFPNCRACFSYADGCTSCQFNYALTSKTQCTLCYLVMPYCYLCDSSTINCRQCNSSLYALNTNTNPDVCQLCNVSLQNCVNCNNMVYCLACVNSTYGLYYIYGWPMQRQYCRLCSDYMQGCYNCSNLGRCLTCVNNSYTLNKNTNLCEKCSVIIYCTTCNASYFCLSCMDQRYALVYLLNLTYMQVCQPCDNLMKGCLYCSSSVTCTKCLQGKATGGGCTSVVGCDYVNSTISVEANCLSCDPLSFYLTPVNGSLCICLEGWIVGDYCTTIIGCTGLTIRNTVKVCLNCNFSGHFELSNDTCVCKKQYFLKEQVCQQICGDGYRISLPCDDGNLIDGDGCSSSCQLQQNFICKNDPGSFPATSCQFKGKVSLSLVGLYKVAGKNQVQIVFSISPYNDVMLKMNFTQTVFFNSTGSNLSSSYIASQQLVLTVDYFRNIEGETAKIIIEFDSNYVISPNFNLLFSMIESTGLTLSYDQSSTGMNEMFGAATNIIGYVLMAVFAVGSVCYKMIGVETIQTVQIILNLQAASLYYKTLFSNFKGLNIAYGQISSFLPSNQSIKESFYVNLGYQFDMNHNYAVLGILNVGFIGGYIILKASSYWYACRLQQLKAERQDSQNKLTLELMKANLKASKKCQAKELKIRRVAGLIYNCLLFPFLVGFFFQLFNVIMISQSNQDRITQTSYNIFAISFIYMATSFIFFQEFISLFTKSSSQSQAIIKPDKHRYIPTYLLFMVTTFALTHAVSSGIVNALYGFLAVGGLCSCFLVFLIAYQPYSARIHNISLIYNQILIIFSVAWIISKDQAFYNSKFQTALIYGFIAVLSILLLLAIARLVSAFREIYPTTKPAQKESTPIQKINLQKSKILVNVNDVLSNDVSYIKNYRQNLFQKSQVNSFFQNNDPELDKKQVKAHRDRYRKMFRKRIEERQ